MIGITVFSLTMIRFSTLNLFGSKSGFSDVMMQIDNKFEIIQSGGSHDLVTHSVNKYVACTYNAQIT